MMRQFLILFLVLALCGCAALPEEALPGSPSTAAPTETAMTQAPTLPTMPAATTTPTVPTEPVPPDPVQTLLDTMTLEEQVGQLFLARCPENGALEDISNYHLGGFVLFARDFENETPDSLREKLESYQAASRIPMLLAVDEEGGTVTRVSRYPAFRDGRFPSPRDLYDRGGLELVLSKEEEKCQLLASLGLNVNLGPVCDVTTDPAAFMYQRSLGRSPEETGRFAAAMVDCMARHGIGAVLKHFPGYGNNTDTHVAIATDDRPLAQLEAQDLVPFQAAIDGGCDAIMVSHVYINAIDPQNPATLSPAVHQYLRENMGFAGVIVTDDLAMSAITDTYGAGEAAVLAVLAGNDLLCVTDYAVQYQAVLDAVLDGRISQEILEDAVTRILTWKMELGLLG